MGNASGAKAMTKGALLKAIATEHGLKAKACSNVLNSLVTVATGEVKKTGVFTVPGVCRSKTSKDCCESFPSGSSEEADLDEFCMSAFMLYIYCTCRGNPTEKHSPPSCLRHLSRC